MFNLVKTTEKNSGLVLENLRFIVADLIFTSKSALCRNNYNTISCNPEFFF